MKNKKASSLLLKLAKKQINPRWLTTEETATIKKEVEEMDTAPLRELPNFNGNYLAGILQQAGEFIKLGRKQE